MKGFIFNVFIAAYFTVMSGRLPLGSQEPAEENEQARRLREIYTAELGVHEATNHNDGARVEEYLHYTGLKRGSAWCAAFVCYCLGKAGVPNPRSGYCPDLFRGGKVIWVKGEGGAESLKGKGESLKRKGESLRGKGEAESLKERGEGLGGKGESGGPAAGDVFGLYFPEKGRIAHVGFVDQWGEKYMISVEGNTNEAGSRKERAYTGRGG